MCIVLKRNIYLVKSRILYGPDKNVCPCKYFTQLHRQHKAVIQCLLACMLFSSFVFVSLLIVTLTLMEILHMKIAYLKQMLKFKEILFQPEIET